jgi:transposase
MEKLYTKEERIEALKLAEEIGAAATAQRLGIKEGTIYG